MKKSRFTEEQIAFALKQAETGTRIDEICRKMGISDATFYKWRQKYGGLGPSELRKLKQLEEENSKLKRIVADLSLDKAMLQDVLSKKALKPSRKRELATDLMERFGASMRKACAVIKLSRVVYLYQSHARDSSALVMRMKEITQTRVHYGYRRVHVMLRREGFRDNHKRVYRLYREQGWSLRQKRPKRNKAAQLRQPKKLALHINQIWSMDFVADNLFDGRKLRMLTVVDCYTRESLDIYVDQSLKGEDVVRVLNNIVAIRGKPMTIKTDNGSEFISKVLDKWAYERGIELDFSRPGKPTDNPMVESFNGRLRQECLNEHWFISLQDARNKIEAWRSFYNEERPHSALDWQTPKEFALKNGSKPCIQNNKEPDLLTSEW